MADEDAVRAHLQERAHTLRPQRPTPSANRTASRTCRTQYSGSTQLLGRHPPGHVRHHRDPRHRTSTPRDRRGTRPASAPSTREWNAWLTPQPLVRRPAHRRRHRRAPRPRHRRAPPTPDRYRRDPTPPLTASSGQHLGLGRLDRDHRATGRQRLHQPPPRRHQRARVRQRQHPGHMRRGHLPDRVPDQEVRAHTPRLHQPEQRHLDREQRRPARTPSDPAAPRPHPATTHPAPAGPDASSCAHTSSNASANTGNASYSSRPIPARCEPWPVNRNASARACAGRRSPARDRRRAAGDAAQADAAVVPVVAPSTTARCSSAARAGTDD